jgi:flagellar biosynthesis anti-sigma factor FlgM
MKINDYRAAQIAQTYGTQGVAAGNQAKPKRGAPRADGASVSAEARELLKARRAAQEAPDVRSALVTELRRQVQSGTYRADAHALARRLARELNLEDA